MPKKSPGPERRRSKRIPVLESFSVAAVLPGRGDLRLPLEDISEVGIGIRISQDLLEHPGLVLTAGSQIDLQLYLNQSLFLPLKVRVVRSSQKNDETHIGMDFIAGRPDAIAAVSHFVKMVDILSQVGTVV